MQNVFCVDAIREDSCRIWPVWMLWIDPIGERFAKVIEFHASDDLVAVLTVDLVCVFLRRNAVSFDDFNRQRNRAIDAAILQRGRVDKVNDHLACFDHLTLNELLDFRKVHAAIDVADFAPFCPSLIADFVDVLNVGALWRFNLRLSTNAATDHRTHDCVNDSPGIGVVSNQCAGPCTQSVSPEWPE